MSVFFSSVKDQLNIPKFNTDNIVEMLNNNDLMAKLFPSNDHSNSKINMLKFLAGPEATIIDSLVDELKKIKNGN